MRARDCRSRARRAGAERSSARARSDDRGNAERARGAARAARRFVTLRPAPPASRPGLGRSRRAAGTSIGVTLAAGGQGDDKNSQNPVNFSLRPRSASTTLPRLHGARVCARSPTMTAADRRARATSSSRRARGPRPRGIGERARPATLPGGNMAHDTDRRRGRRSRSGTFRAVVRQGM
jgi:hypothetical protein